MFINLQRKSFYKIYFTIIVKDFAQKCVKVKCSKQIYQYSQPFKLELLLMLTPIIKFSINQVIVQNINLS